MVELKKNNVREGEIMIELKGMLENHPEVFAAWAMTTMLEIMIFCIVIIAYHIICDCFIRKGDSIELNDHNGKWIFHYKTTTHRVFAVMTSNTGILTVCVIYCLISRMNHSMEQVNSYILFGLILVEKILVDTIDKKIEISEFYYNGYESNETRTNENNPEKDDAIPSLRLMSSIEVLIVLTILTLVNHDKTYDYSTLAVCMNMLDNLRYMIIATVMIATFVLTGFLFRIIDSHNVLEAIIICHYAWILWSINTKRLSEEMCGILLSQAHFIYEFVRMIKEKRDDSTTNDK